MSNLVDFASLPVLDLWGETVRGRRVDGERITLALVELAPDAIVPGHEHENEQLGVCITGRLTFTVGDEVRELGPGGTWRIPSGVHHQVTVGPGGASVIDIFAPVRSDWEALPEHAPQSPAWPDQS
ncbi:MAG: cupin domain-containing protein [Chloroflexota bacterium]